MVSYNIERAFDGSVTINLVGKFNSMEETFSFVEMVENLTSKYTPLQRKVITLMQGGFKLQALKLYKDESGKSLKDSKDDIENLYRDFVSSPQF